MCDVLRERCEEAGRPFEAIERTVTSHVVIRETQDAATAAWDVIARRHGIVGRVGADGTSRGLTAGGAPHDVANYLAGYRDLGFAEVMIVFRSPFDLETIERIGEVRSSLEAVATSPS